MVIYVTGRYKITAQFDDPFTFSFIVKYRSKNWVNKRMHKGLSGLL